jgi:hypothetical protein
MKELDRLEYITRHYYDLQMVRFAPVWCFLLGGVALKRLFVRYYCPSVLTVVAGVLVFLLVQTAWYLLANRYYQRRFGKVETSKAIAMPMKPNSIYLAVLLTIVTWSVLDRFFLPHNHAWFPFMLASLLAGPSFATNQPTWRRWTYGVCGDWGLCSLDKSLSFQRGHNCHDHCHDDAASRCVRSLAARELVLSAPQEYRCLTAEPDSPRLIARFTSLHGWRFSLYSPRVIKPILRFCKPLLD